MRNTFSENIDIINFIIENYPEKINIISHDLIQKNDELAFRLIEIKPLMLEFSSSKLEVMNLLSDNYQEKHPDVYPFIEEELRNKTEMIKYGVECGENSLKSLNDDIKDDKELVLHILNEPNNMYEDENLEDYISERLRDDDEVILYIIANKKL